MYYSQMYEKYMATSSVCTIRCSFLNYLVILHWIWPQKPSQFYYHSFLHNNKMWKIIYVLMYVFDILVDVSFEFSLKKICYL